MKIAYLLFDGITTLDFIGIYDPISRIKALKYLPNLSWDVCAFEDESIEDSFGLKIKIDKIKPDLSVYNMIIVPGGYGTRSLQFNVPFLEWLKTAAPVKYKVAICTGSLLLGAAGFLKGKKATTHFDAYNLLAPYCKEVIASRIVEDGDAITAGAVASSLDIGLYLCEKLLGKEKRIAISKSMDYHSFQS